MFLFIFLTLFTFLVRERGIVRVLATGEGFGGKGLKGGKGYIRIEIGK